MPVHDAGGGVIGVMGTVRSYAGQAMAIQPFVQIESAVEHIRNNFREKISVNGLAQRAGLSRRQFDRKFQEAFGISPQQFIIKTRVQAACEALADAKVSIVRGLRTRLLRSEFLHHALPSPHGGDAVAIP